ncbi:MAG: hypothetical protein ACO3RV_06165, partial [Luteolibacter sp.]
TTFQIPHQMLKPYKLTEGKQAVRAISTFAKSGELGPKTLHLLDRVEAPDGSVPYRRVRPQETPTQVIDSATAWQIHSILAGSLEHGSSAGALTALVEKPFHGAGKGGSTHDFSDCWFLGYNSRVSCGVWTGFLDAGTDPIYPGAFSRDLALPVWVATMNAAAPSFGGNPIPPPENLVKATVCSQSGQRPTPYCQKHVGDPTTGFIESASTSITEYFRAGTEPSAFCELHFGGGSDSSPGTSMILGRPILNVAPVIPTESVLVGEDPYHTDLPGPSGHETASGWSRRPTNVLDSLDLGEVEESIPLRRPQRLEIHDD